MVESIDATSANDGKFVEIERFFVPGDDFSYYAFGIYAASYCPALLIYDKTS